MNIFVLSHSPIEAAQAHCNKHVTKMCLEYAQLLCTAAHLAKKTSDGLYKPTHINHPCSVWTRASIDNIEWLAQLLSELGIEHQNRFGTIHKSVAVGLHAAHLLGADRNQHIVCSSNCTTFAQAMPDIYKNPDAVIAYRQYYIGEKAKIAKWSNGSPKWWPKAIIV